MSEPLGNPTFTIRFDPDTLEEIEVIQHAKLDVSKVPDSVIRSMAKRVLADMKKAGYTA